MHPGSGESTASWLLNLDKSELRTAANPPWKIRLPADHAIAQVCSMVKAEVPRMHALLVNHRCADTSGQQDQSSRAHSHSPAKWPNHTASSPKESLCRDQNLRQEDKLHFSLFCYAAGGRAISSCCLLPTAQKSLQVVEIFALLFVSVQELVVHLCSWQERWQQLQFLDFFPLARATWAG